MVDIGKWVRDLTQKLWNVFGDRLEFMGLQGSYARGEANEQSDIDLVVVLDVLTVDDLRAYRKVVRSMPEAQKACGFICGREELRGWPVCDLFHLYYDTAPLCGYLEELLPPICREDAMQAAMIGAANLYHMACHGYLYEDRAQTLAQCYKDAFFVMRALWFAKTGDFIKTHEKLHEMVSPEEQKILERAKAHVNINPRDSQSIDEAFGELIEWSGSILERRE